MALPSRSRLPHPPTSLSRGRVDEAHGITFTQAWSTSNTLCTQTELENLIAKGLKLKFDTTHPPSREERKSRCFSTPLTNSLAFNPVLSSTSPRFLPFFLLFFSPLALSPIYSTRGPTFTADTVLGLDGFLVGAEASYNNNVTEGRVTKYSAAVGFSVPEYAVTLHSLSNFSTFAASHYHRVNPDVEAGAKAVYDVKVTSPGVALEVGTKAYLDSAVFIKAEINNSGVLALGGHSLILCLDAVTLHPGVKASFGLALDTQRLNEVGNAGPAHKVGAQFVFEA
ncbi:eukaryotic porin-domain-containing protein [Lactarius hatsudake]|nr:eukaryotic porin-domain-containing protein [Lactarius hatsudake]